MANFSNSFEFVLYEVKSISPTHTSTTEQVQKHQHSKRSSFQTELPDFSDLSLDLNFTTSSSSLISRSNSSNQAEEQAEREYYLPISNAMTPSTSSERGRPSTSNSLSSRSSRTRSPNAHLPVNDTLITDMKMSKNRMIITKKYTAYNNPLIPYPSAIVGFNVAFHNPPAARSRVRDAEFNLYFNGLNLDSPSPIIKAISPGPGTSRIGDSTSTEHTTTNEAGISLGYNPHGSLTFSHSHSETWIEESSAKLVVSGISTNHAMITLEEDSHTQLGIPSNFNFAILVALPPSTDTSIEGRGFEIDFSVECSIGLGVGEQFRKRFVGSPRDWRLGYDGFTELGKIELSDDLLIEGV